MSVAPDTGSGIPMRCAPSHLQRERVDVLERESLRNLDEHASSGIGSRGSHSQSLAQPKVSRCGPARALAPVLPSCLGTVIQRLSPESPQAMARVPSRVPRPRRRRRSPPSRSLQCPSPPGCRCPMWKVVAGLSAAAGDGAGTARKGGDGWWPRRHLPPRAVLWRLLRVRGRFRGPRSGGGAVSV